MTSARTGLAGAVLGLLVSCTSSTAPPGQVVAGTLNIIGALSSSDCPFDAYPSGRLIDLKPDGTLQLDGGGLSPPNLDVTWTLSLSPAEGRLYLSNGVAQRQGSLVGGAFVVEDIALRSICGNAWLDERLTGSFYGPPQAPGPDGGCLMLSGPGLYPDAGVWSLQADDGGLSDGGPASAPSGCFAPAGLLPGASLADGFSVLPDAGLDGGSLCELQTASGPTCASSCSDDGGVVRSCATTYSLRGAITP